MKALVNKVLSVAILIMASNIVVFSQTRSKEHSLSPFEGIEASGGFSVSITKSDAYSAKLTVDDALESYVVCYVKAGVLHLGLDEKKVPKELKKQYRGKNSPGRTLVALVSMPAIKSLALSDDSEFFCSDELAVSDLSVNLSGSSSVNNLKVRGKRVDLNVAKNARFTNAAVVAEEDVNVFTDGKGAVVMECEAANVSITAAGSSEVDAKVDVDEKLKISLSAGSGVTVSGKSLGLEIVGKGTSAKVDASGLEVKGVVIGVGGVSVDINASDSLELDLGRGAEVTFAGNPEINIVKIQNASVIRK